MPDLHKETTGDTPWKEKSTFQTTPYLRSLEHSNWSTGSYAISDTHIIHELGGLSFFFSFFYQFYLNFTVTTLIYQVVEHLVDSNIDPNSTWVVPEPLLWTITVWIMFKMWNRFIFILFTVISIYCKLIFMVRLINISHQVAILERPCFKALSR